GNGILQKTILQEIDAKVRPQWIGQIGMIEHVVEIRPDLHGHPFSQFGVFGEAEVEIPVVRAGERVPAEIAEVFRAGNTVAGSVVGARDVKSRKIEQHGRAVRAGEGIANPVRAAEKLATAVEVAFEQVVDVVRLAGGKRSHTVQAPS